MIFKKRRDLKRDIEDLKSDNEILREKVKEIEKRFNYWSEETNERLASWKSSLCDRMQEWNDSVKKTYNDDYKKFSEANIRHHKLIEGWLKELRDFISESRSR